MTSWVPGLGEGIGGGPCAWTSRIPKQTEAAGTIAAINRLARLFMETPFLKAVRTLRSRTEIYMEETDGQAVS